MSDTNRRFISSMIARSIKAELTLMNEKFTSPPMPCIIMGIAKIMLTQ